MKEEPEVAVDIVSLTILFKEGKSAIKLQLESSPSPTSTATPLTSAASAPAPGGRRHASGEAACVIICQPQLGRSTSSPTLHHHLLQDLGRGRCHCASPLHHHHHLHAPPHDHLRTTLTSTLTPTVRLRARRAPCTRYRTISSIFFVLDLFFLCLHLKSMYIEMLEIHF